MLGLVLMSTVKCAEKELAEGGDAGILNQAETSGAVPRGDNLDEAEPLKIRAPVCFFLHFSP